MTKRWNSFLRKAAPVLSAGVLFQTSGCTLNLEAFTQNVVLGVLDELISSILFGLFPAGGL